MRKKSPPRRGHRYPSVAEAKRKQWEDPEWRAMMVDKLREVNAKRKLDQSNYRYGIPDGMRRPEAEAEWNFARMYAKEVTRIMSEENLLPEDPKVEQAFTAAVEVLTAPNNQTVKLQAARLILDFCKAKPVAKSEVTVKSAEDWLAQVTADHIKKEENG